MMQFNPLIDRFPTSYDGYSIRTDFRTGVLLGQMFSDAGMSDDDKKISALKLLYISGRPADITEAWAGVEWFLRGGNNKCSNAVEQEKEKEEPDDEDAGEDVNLIQRKKSGDEPLLDFDFDASRIYTAFLRTYGIDLETSNMHYFKFLYMLADLDSDSAHSRVLEIRTTSLKGKKGEELRKWRHMKKMYEVPTVIDEDAKQKLGALGIDESDLDLFAQF